MLGRPVDSFKLLLNSKDDIRVLSHSALVDAAAHAESGRDAGRYSCGGAGVD